MTVILAAIRDHEDQQVARVEARQESDNLAIQIVWECPSWQESLAELNRVKLHFMIDGEVYHQRQDADQKEFVSLGSTVPQLSNQQLQVVYDPAGVECAHELLRGIARQQPHAVPFTDLLDILNQASRAG